MATRALTAAPSPNEVSWAGNSAFDARIATVVTLVEYSDSAPTQALRDLYESLALRAQMELVKLDRCLADDVAAFNALCREAGVDSIVRRVP